MKMMIEMIGGNFRDSHYDGDHRDNVKAVITMTR